MICRRTNNYEFHSHECKLIKPFRSFFGERPLPCQSNSYAANDFEKKICSICVKLNDRVEDRKLKAENSLLPNDLCSSLFTPPLTTKTSLL